MLDEASEFAQEQIHLLFAKASSEMVSVEGRVAVKKPYFNAEKYHYVLIYHVILESGLLALAIFFSVTRIPKRVPEVPVQ